MIRKKLLPVLLVAIAFLLLGGCAYTSGSGASSDRPEETSPSDAAAHNAAPPAPPASDGQAVPDSRQQAGSSDKAAVRTAPTGDKLVAPKAPADDAEKQPGAQIDRVVVVIEENHSYKQIVGNKDAPYLNGLIRGGALFTDAHGVTHPSQPNYFALFSGSTQGVKDDSCGKTLFRADNLATELAAKKLSFAGYSEDQPKAGYRGCSVKGYGRKHNPWAQFANVPDRMNLPFDAFPDKLEQLPTVSFVVPNHRHDMHDGTVREADDWLKAHLDAYVRWANTHHGLLIVTWDEDDFSKSNHIPLVMVGPMVKPGTYSAAVNHYDVLRTIEDQFGLKPLGQSAKAKPIADIWTKS